MDNGELYGNFREDSRSLPSNSSLERCGVCSYSCAMRKGWKVHYNSQRNRKYCRSHVVTTCFGTDSSRLTTPGWEGCVAKLLRRCFPLCSSAVKTDQDTRRPLYADKRREYSKQRIYK